MALLIVTRYDTSDAYLGHVSQSAMPVIAQTKMMERAAVRGQVRGPLQA